MSEKKQITISSVIALLEQGNTRKEIAEHFDIPMTDVKKMFKHPKLKGKKPHKVPNFELVDDTQESPIQEEASQPLEVASATHDESWGEEQKEAQEA